MRVAVCVQVFARVSPEQKELVVVALRAVGRTVLMCGDGTNDVGGLKAAHVGVALLSASQAAVSRARSVTCITFAAMQQQPITHLCCSVYSREQPYG
jgi:P-type E1-E2 ATPase